MSRPDTKYDMHRLRQGFVLYGLFALLLVPGSTIALAGRGNAWCHSLSVIGNMAGNRLALILWTMGSSGFFVYALRFLLQLCKQKRSLSEPLMCLSGGMLVLCNLLPFLPNKLPRLAQYHNFLAMSAAFLLALSLLVFALDLWSFDAALAKKTAGLLALAGMSGGIPFFLFGVSGALEVVCIILVCLFLFFSLILAIEDGAFGGMGMLAEQNEGKKKARPEG